MAEAVQALEPTSRPTVVVVETSVQARHAGAKQLRVAGYRVLEATDGGGAFLLLAAYGDIAAVVADLCSPGSGNGLAISQWLARETSHPGVAWPERSR